MMQIFICLICVNVILAEISGETDKTTTDLIATTETTVQPIVENVTAAQLIEDVIVINTRLEEVKLNASIKSNSREPGSRSVYIFTIVVVTILFVILSFICFVALLLKIRNKCCNNSDNDIYPLVTV